MPYPKNIDQKLEFDQVKALAASKCLSELGRQYIEKIRFVNRFDVLEKILVQVKEFRELLISDTPFPSEHFYDVRPSLKKAAIQGTFLQEDEWHHLKLLLGTFHNICKYFEQRTERYAQLSQLFGGINFNSGLVKNIERVIDENGVMRPNASLVLAKIVSKIAEKEKEARKRISQIFEKAGSQGWLADTGITIRDGRLVLPVLAEYKRNVNGFVHDESATGQTVFIEPAEIFEINNLIREQQIAYRREKEKILLELTDKLRPSIPELEGYIQRIGLIDFIRAKALLAVELGAYMPLLDRHAKLKLVKAYHPLLKLNHEKAGLAVVPLNVELSQEKRVLVISGPNAGGKSVCLKTIGLLQYMLQCGFLVPCAEHSEMGVFNDMMVDIGDEQSIENDLSTYSSHLLHMKYFTDFADAKTMFLIDEFGTGTDPQFGGPLAEAILNRLNQKQSWGVVTTHYSNLKNFASNTRGLENACMLFDQQHMQPTYILETGKPGSSYAFELAAKSGLGGGIIDYAKQKVGDKQKRVDDLLIELEREKKHVHDLKARFEKRDTEARELVEKYSRLKDDIEANRKKLLSQAKQEALSIITEANSRIENTIREIREKKADTDTIRKVRQEIREETETLKTEAAPEEQPKPASPVSAAALKVGDHVQLEGQSEPGEVVEINRNKALVAFGDLRSWVDLKKLLPAAKMKKREDARASFKGYDMNEKMRGFSADLNLIGVRGEEAIKQLQLYLDEAYLLGFKQVRIVHGKGYGILRKLVRNYLKNSQLVENVSNEHIEMGGDGVSIVTLRV